MSSSTETRQKLSGAVPDAPEKTDATNPKLSITLDAMSEHARRNREYQRRWYYRNGGRPQDDHRRALVSAAARRFRAKKKAEREKIMK